jgi:hypothetical protein
MTTKKVEMAIRDPRTRQLVVDEVEVEVVRVNVRNRDLRRTGGHVLNIIICGEVYFKPGDVKTLELSKDEVAEIKRRRNGAWEITTAAPTAATLADDEAEAADEDIREPTSSEASALAAAAEAAAAEAEVAEPRVQRRRLR